VSSTPIRQAVAVRADPERAFEVFTAGMGSWWPLDAYSRAVNELLQDEGVVAERLEFESGPGGRILEHLSDGRVLPWAEVVAWEPPRRVVMAWRPHSLPEPPTDVEVTFSAQGDGTMVELEHRGWELLSEGFREAMYGLYADGWPATLDRFAAVAGGIATEGQ
jgi:uncharacterized protein YndB with AHSA1/START domain